tara:strand:- start:479 stop:1399 length:921 start_codon:yes stop_codon:yes gene_type:complete
MPSEQVELDIDNVEEKSIEVSDDKQEETKPVLEEVDLGYSDPIKSDTKAEVVKEEPEEKQENTDNLQEMSGKVQKRIDGLTRKMREAERREKAALDYAKGLQKKYTDVEQKFVTSDDNYLKEYEARVDSQREQVKNSLKSAIEENDTDKIMEANDKLTQLAVEKEKARIQTAQKEQQKEQQKQVVQEPVAAQRPRQKPSERAEGWARKNEWFGKDKPMTNAAYGIHEELVSQGFDSESDEYYNEIDRKLSEYFPHKFSVEKKPVQTVASAGRKQEGRRKVTLTRSQVAIAKKLGVPLEEYARYVKE